MLDLLHVLFGGSFALALCLEPALLGGVRGFPTDGTLRLIFLCTGLFFVFALLISFGIFAFLAIAFARSLLALVGIGLAPISHLTNFHGIGISASGTARIRSGRHPDAFRLQVRRHYVTDCVVVTQHTSVHCQVLAQCRWSFSDDHCSLVFIADGFLLAVLAVLCFVSVQVRFPFLQS